MTVKELIEKLSLMIISKSLSLDSNSQVLIRFINEEGCKDLEYFDEYDVKVNGNTIIIDISDK